MNSAFSMSRYFCALLSSTVPVASLSLANLATGWVAASLMVIAPVTIAPAAAQSAAPAVNYNLLYVNPIAGDDASDGSTQAPFRTLTRALEAAPEGTIIVLTPGTYSTATGERFPIFMKSGVTIQGDPRDRGQGIVINGSGDYLSRTFARQKVAIVGANRAGLRGVTITNKASQGYGLWIESSSPVVSDNTFMGSDHDGVSIVGSSAPILRNNYFLENGANGITIYGNSTAELIENIFEKTGFGINVAQNATPRLISNHITQNKDGIVVQGSAQPILRNNIIDRNTRDGLVVIAQAQPDLGNSSEPGGNTFVGNGGMDVNAKTATATIPAVGNQLSRSSGNLDPNAIATAPQTAPRFASLRDRPTAPITTPTTLAAGGTATPVVPRVASTNPTAATAGITPPTAANALPILTLPATPNRLSPKLLPIVVPATGDLSGNGVTSRQSLPKVPELRVSRQTADSGTASSAPSNTASTEGSPLALTSAQPISIPINVPAPEAGVAAQPARPDAAAPRLARGDVLAVPGGNIPLGNVGSSPSVPVWQAGQAGAAAVRYRVLVAAIDSTQTAAVQSIAPGAFSTRVRGEIMLQAGAFSDRTKAEELLNQLTSQGLPAMINQ
jgi:parallel beta-helix repeat protein